MLHIKNKNDITFLKFESFNFQAESFEFISKLIQNNKDLKHFSMKDCSLSNQSII
jgi:hypothetical protein